MVRSRSDVGSLLRVVVGALSLGCGALVLACDSPSEVPADAVQFTPPAVFQRWWAMTQTCAGRARSLNAVRWYHVPGSHFVAAGRDLRGYYNPKNNSIVLSDSLAAFGAGVRHEMLHAVLDVPGHPRDMFQGYCASTVTCPTGCSADGGPWTAPSAWVPMRPESLVVTSTATLMPTEIDGDRWLVIRATVRNPQPLAVLVAMPTAQTFSFVLAQAGAGGDMVQDAMFAADSSSYYFAPTETKEFLFELRVGDAFTRYSVPPGDYKFAAGFGMISSGWAPVSVMRLEGAAIQSSSSAK